MCLTLTRPMLSDTESDVDAGMDADEDVNDEGGEPT